MNNPSDGIICLGAILIFILLLFPSERTSQPIQQQECVTYDDNSKLELHFGGKGRERVEDDKIYKNYFKY